MTATSALALASTAILATAIGTSGFEPARRWIRARTLRPLHASATASSSRAGTPVHGSGGEEEEVSRVTSHPQAAAQTAPTPPRHGRDGATAPPPGCRPRP